LEEATFRCHLASEEHSFSPAFPRRRNQEIPMEYAPFDAQNPIFALCIFWARGGVIWVDVVNWYGDIMLAGQALFV
jgi:hypothetical protein